MNVLQSFPGLRHHLDRQGALQPIFGISTQICQYVVDISIVSGGTSSTEVTRGRTSKRSGMHRPHFANAPYVQFRNLASMGK